MSATPPTFNPAPAKSGNKIWLWIILAIVGFCLIISGGIFFLGKSLLDTGLEIASCAFNGEMGANAVLAYAKENEGELPPAESWQDDIRPYYETLYDKTASEMTDEEMPGFINFDLAKPGYVLTCNNGDDFKTGFAYNEQLAGTNIADYDDPGSIILLWETVNPVYNGSGDPSTRAASDPNLKIFGDTRDWWDYYLDGESVAMQGGSNDVTFSISPDDAIDSSGANESDVEADESN